MKIMKTFSVLGAEGYFYEGEFSGTTCFVPVSAIQAGCLNEALRAAVGCSRPGSGRRFRENARRRRLGFQA